MLDIFQLHRLESNLGGTAFGWEGCSHRISAVCSKEWRRLPRLRFFPVCMSSPWRCRMLLSTCSTNDRNRERTVRRETDSGDPPGPSRTQASAPLEKKLPPNRILTLGPTGLSNLVNKRNKFPTMTVIGELFFQGYLGSFFCCCGKGVSGI